MSIYANLLGEWTELTDDIYSIDGFKPSKAIDTLLYQQNNSEKLNGGYIEVQNNETLEIYIIHYSDIQLTSVKKSEQKNEP